MKLHESMLLFSTRSSLDYIEQLDRPTVIRATAHERVNQLCYGVDP